MSPVICAVSFLSVVLFVFVVLIQAKKEELPKIALGEVLRAMVDREDVYGIKKNPQLLPEGDARLGNSKVKITYTPSKRSDDVLIERIILSYKEVEFSLLFHSKVFAGVSRDGIEFAWEDDHTSVSQTAQKIYRLVVDALP
jgi:hypothetical protein